MGLINVCDLNCFGSNFNIILIVHKAYINLFLLDVHTYDD